MARDINRSLNEFINQVSKPDDLTSLSGSGIRIDGTGTTAFSLKVNPVAKAITNWTKIKEEASTSQPPKKTIANDLTVFSAVQTETEKYPVRIITSDNPSIDLKTISETTFIWASKKDVTLRSLDRITSNLDTRNLGTEAINVLSGGNISIRYARRSFTYDAGNSIISIEGESISLLNNVIDEYIREQEEIRVASIAPAAETLAGTTSEVFAEDLNARLTQAEADIDANEASILQLDELKAPLASPALTGTPTAPTASQGNNTTQIATTQFVTGALTDLIDGAPAVLDTLNEIAASLGDDPDFAGTLTATLALKAPLASPSFTGTVSMGTPLAVASGGTGGSSTSVALNNLLPSGETAGYVLKTNGPGSYFWDAETGASLIVGTRINTSRTFFTATAAQTVFTGIGEYTIGASQLRVYLDGVRQFDSEYTETSSTSFTLDVGVPSGTIVLAEVDGFVSYPVTANAVSVTPTGGITATDAQNALAGLDARAFVAGMIIMWSGAIANIPTGWALCNGSNGTPDLRDRMVIGASSDDASVAKTNVTGSLTTSGGSKDAIVVSHTHTGTTDGDGGHGHNVIGSTNIGAPKGLAESTARGVAAGDGTASNGYKTNIGNTANAVIQAVGNHTHTFTTDSEGSSGTDANLPPYYALAFIMKL